MILKNETQFLIYTFKQTGHFTTCRSAEDSWAIVKIQRKSKKERSRLLYLNCQIKLKRQDVVIFVSISTNCIRLGIKYEGIIRLAMSIIWRNFRQFATSRASGLICASVWIMQFFTSDLWSLRKEILGDVRLNLASKDVRHRIQLMKSTACCVL